MRTFTSVFKGSTLVVLVLIVLTAGGTSPGYGQSAGQLSQSTQCQPFQQTIVADISGASTARIRFIPRTAVTIEEIALKIDAIDYVAPVVAAVTTSVRSVVSAYYLPIPSTEGVVIPPRPLTLMELVHLHADGGTDMTFSITVDPRYSNGVGRAEWSVSGLSCAA